MSTNAGTPNYQAPEILNGKYDGKKADIFSFGLTLYSILYDSIPFHDVSTAYAVQQKIQKGERPLLIKHLLPKEMNKLIRSCWESNPKKRPDFNTVLGCFILSL